MISLLPELNAHLLPLQDRLACFCKYGIQAEGWFKGEVLALLDGLLAQGRLDALDREVRQPGGRIDLYLEIAGQAHWVELKHWLVGRQRDADYGPQFYFNDPTSIGITRDVDRLIALEGPGLRWLLVLATANPGPRAWQAGLREFHRKFAPRVLRPCSDPADYPPTYFLGLLEVSQAPQRASFTHRGVARRPAVAAWCVA